MSKKVGRGERWIRKNDNIHFFVDYISPVYVTVVRVGETQQTSKTYPKEEFFKLFKKARKQ